MGLTFILSALRLLHRGFQIKFCIGLNCKMKFCIYFMISTSWLIRGIVQNLICLRNERDQINKQSLNKEWISTLLSFQSH